MLNNTVKQQINTARDILVGKIPDPKGQIDQITNALIYKFMDDQDRLSLTLPGGKANFFVNELKPYAWHKLFDGKLSNQDKANLYVEGIAKLSVSRHLPDLFLDIFKDAFLPFRAPDTIAMFLGEINKFDYHHSEDLGNAFEYLLSIMGSQGDAGQFRTPRNIIEFIVDAVDPSKDDHILDPACGTAGFLVEAYKHITKDKELTPNEIQELAQHIHGVDIDPGMAKIARVNLYLHGFKTPLITEDDTLSDERLWGKKYDVILANPPFMTPKGGIVPHDKFFVQSNRAEVLFTDYIAEHLKLSGRAGVVVPEGIIFQSGNLYKKLRKMLVDDNYLWAVISLPTGVFNPYSGVKTSILLFDRERSSKNTEILFFKVNNDGFDLGAQRREISKNDLPEALEILKKWKNNEKVENSKAIYIEKEKIGETGDYKLSIDQYRTAIDYTNAKWPMMKLGELEKDEKIYFLRGQGLSKNDISGDGKSKCIHYGEIYTIYGPIIKNVVSQTNFEGKILSEKGDVLVPATTTADALGIAVARSLNEQGVIIGGDINIIRTLNKHILSDYLAYLISNPPLKIALSTFAKGANILHLSNSDLKQLLIPFPPLEIQEQIVAELDGYAGIIAGAKQITQNWKPKIDIDPEWEKVKLGEVCSVLNGYAFKADLFNDQKIGLPIIRIRDVNTGFSETYYSGEYDKKYIVNDGDFLIGMDGDFRTTFWRYGKSLLNQRVCRLEKFKNADIRYLSYLIQDELDLIHRSTVAVTVKHISSSQIEKIEIPLPPLATQKQIVEKIETERTLMDGNKKLIEIYEQKTKEVVMKLWEE